jgi:phage terminase small subunit
MTKKLTPKQQRFIDEYLVDLNGAQAAIRAGYSRRTADRIAHETLRKPAVASAVAERMRARSEKVGADAEWVLRRLVAEAESDLADLYDEVGNLRPPRDWPAIWRTGLVAGVETFMVPKGQDAEGKPVYAEVRKLKLADRTRIVEMIGKHVRVGAFRDQVGLSAPDGGPVQVVEVPLDNIQKALERVRSRAATAKRGAAK